MKQEALEAMLEKACNDLGEHCESVIIIITAKCHSADKYMRLSHRSGNFYTNYGAVTTYIEDMRQSSTVEAIKELKEE